MHEEMPAEFLMIHHMRRMATVAEQLAGLLACGELGVALEQVLDSVLCRARKILEDSSNVLKTDNGNSNSYKMWSITDDIMRAIQRLIEQHKAGGENV